MSTVPTLAALIACPRNLELSFISSFPIQMTCSSRDTSRRIKDLVSPQYVRFKRQRCLLQWRGTGRRRWAGQSVNYTNQLAHAKGIFGQWKPQIVANLV